MEYFDMQIRIPYADVDQMDVVYYANYLVYFERGRTELLRACNVNYRDIEKKYKLYLPVREVSIEYHAPARYDDLITVRTRIKKIKRVSMYFSYEVYDENKKLLVTGTTSHVFVNSRWKPASPPSDILNHITNHIKLNTH